MIVEQVMASRQHILQLFFFLNFFLFVSVKSVALRNQFIRISHLVSNLCSFDWIPGKLLFFNLGNSLLLMMVLLAFHYICAQVSLSRGPFHLLKIATLVNVQNG